jgi:hypothetical protein
MDQNVLTTSNPIFSYIDLGDAVLPRLVSTTQNTPLYMVVSNSTSGFLFVVGKNDISTSTNHMFKIDYSGNLEIQNSAKIKFSPAHDWYVWYDVSPNVFKVGLSGYEAQFTTSGSLILAGGLTVGGQNTVYYMSGDYGLTWTQTMPSGVNGLMVTVYNSNAGILASRWYVYTNGAWKYSALV